MTEKTNEISKPSTKTEGRNPKARGLGSSTTQRNKTINSQLNTPTIEHVLAKTNLKKACERVEANKGAAGVDGIETSKLRNALFKNWVEIRNAILEGKYKPKPVLRVAIPKGDETKRYLGIPTVIDRCLQQAITQVLAPTFDPHFSENSFGFREGKGTHDAIIKAKSIQDKGKRWAVDLDLEKFFDNVNHDLLMARIKRRVKDTRILTLIRAYLRAGIQDGKAIVPSTIGTPQGGPLSPLLSNILLDDLDKELEKRGHSFVRYADDCTILVNSEKAGQRTLRSITNYLERNLKQKVNLTKSKVDKAHRITFLGYGFIPTKDTKIKISKKSISKLRKSLKPLWKKARGRPLEKFIQEDLNPVIRGWANYFSLSNGKTNFLYMDSLIKRHLRNALWRRWRRTDQRARILRAAGLNRQDALRAARAGMGSWPSSGTQLMNIAFDNRFFSKRGLVSMLDIWNDRVDYRRTALVRNRMPGGVGGR
jgi:RNA-directed DNA polymerase